MSSLKEGGVTLGDRLRQIMVEGKKAHAAAVQERMLQQKQSRLQWMKSVVDKCVDTINEALGREFDINSAPGMAKVYQAAEKGYDSCPIEGLNWAMVARNNNVVLCPERSHIDGFPIFNALNGPFYGLPEGESESMPTALEIINNQLKGIGLSVALQKRRSNETYQYQNKYSGQVHERSFTRLVLFLVWDQESYLRRVKNHS